MPSALLKDAEAQFADAIVAALKRVPADLKPPHPAYHFTDEAGLKGILSTRSLWASLAVAMEDTTEIEYALSRARQIIQSHALRCKRSYLDELVPLLDPKTSKTISTLGWKTYVASFRTSTDDSAHWQSYGRSGTGFALAFALKPLVIPGTLCLPVVYEHLAQDRLIIDFLDSSLNLYAHLSRECLTQESDTLRQRAVHWTALGVWTLAPTLKDPRFQGESEWRIIVIDPERVQVDYGKGLTREVPIRHSSNREIPYKVLQYDRLPITGLELGPHAAIDENAPCLRQLLDIATSGLAVPITRATV